jgi:hypothetical protein
MKTIKLLLLLTLLTSCTIDPLTEYVYVEVEGAELQLDPNVVGKWKAVDINNDVGDYTMLYFGYDGSYSMEYFGPGSEMGLLVRGGTWTITSDDLLKVEFNYGYNLEYEGATNSQHYEVTNRGRRLYIGGNRFDRRIWQQ